MKQSQARINCLSQSNPDHQSYSQSQLTTTPGVSSRTSVFLPKPYLQRIHRNLSSAELVLPPKVPIQLPDPKEYLAESLKPTPAQAEAHRSKDRNVTFLIIEMMAKQTVNTDTLHCVGELSHQSKGNESESTETKHEFQEQGLRYASIKIREELWKYPHFLKSRLVYQISYRLAHKFTFRFKVIELEFDTVVSVNKFKKSLFEKLFKKGKISKEVFIEKQRDLVPLIHMSQLFTSKMNFIQIRKEFKKFGVIEKPVLMKKKMKPTIGITQLSNKTVQQYQKVIKLPQSKI